MTKQQEAQDSSLSWRTWLVIATFIVIVGVLAPSAGAGSVSSLQLQTFKTHSRLAISVDSSVETEWKEVDGGFQLLLKGVALQDLYLGSVDLESLRDPRIAEVRVAEAGGGVRIEGKWNFPTGEAAISNPKMEKFTYREPDPARFVVDFWPKAGVPVVEVKRAEKEKARAASVQKAENEAKKRRDRRIAAEAAMEIESDVARFCKEPLKEGVDLFLEFIPEHEAPKLEAHLPPAQPDEGYPFLAPKSGSAEEKYVKLANELYGKGDYALAVRTLDFFSKEVPKSLHLVDMRFLRANALLRLGMKEEAAKAFEQIREENPTTPAALASALYLAEETRKSGNELQTVERYLWIATRFPKHRNVWAWRMLAAESLYRLQQTERAVKEYEWVEAHAPDADARATAALRIGDAYLYRAQHDRALAAYYRAGQKYPEASKNLASAQINRGEALYWLGQLDRAEAQFEDFKTRFPGHPAGWRALLRIAEIEGRREGAAAAAKSRASFLATVNHYPFSPGAVIARMRLIPCDDHGGFDAKTAADFFRTETEKFDGQGQVRTDRFGEFRSIIRVRSMILLDDPVAALDAAIREKEEINRKSGAFVWLKEMERKLFRKQVISLLDAGKRFEAVKFFDQYAAKVNLTEELSEDVTPERVAMADPDYLLRLSRVASELGLGRTAEGISKRYDQEAKRLGLGRSLASGGADLEARLKKSERAFTDAKALWTTKAKPTAVREKLAQMTDESPFAYQKEIILGLMAERESKWATALSHAAKSSMLLNSLTKDGVIERVAVDQWIATLHARGGNPRAAIESYRKLQRSNAAEGVRAKAEGIGLAPIAGREAWMMSEAELCEKLGKWGEAADAYSRAMGEGLGGNRAVYAYALSLEKIGGDDSKVESLLRKVADSEKDDFWKELARKKLAGTTAKEGTGL